MTLEPEDRNTLITHRLKRAHETRNESLLLYENGMLPAAVNRVYYSMFYALSALAISESYQSGKHAQLIGWFNKSYVRTGKIDQQFSRMLSQAFDKRMLGDYADIPDFSKIEVETMIRDSSDFIAMIETLLSTK